MKILKEYTPYKESVEITENRAPTDASIALFAEMREKAFKSIVDTIVVNDNTFNFKACVFNFPGELTEKLVFSLTINGCEIKGSVPMPSKHDRQKPRVAVREIIDKTAHAIALEIVKNTL